MTDWPRWRAEAVESEYLRVRQWLLPAMVDTTEAELLAELAANRATLWPAPNAAMVTQLIAPDFLHVWIAGGDLSALLDMRGGIEAWGRAQGARKVSINGRRGWARVLAQHGYQPDGEELVKVL